MTARVWTIAELDRVHPLPDGWSWDVAFGASPVARRGTGIGSVAVWVDEDHRELTSEKTVEGCDVPVDTMRVDPPADVALAVILASKGLDSREAMASAVAREAARLVPATRDQTAHSWAGYGREALARVAAMLRRGTVQP